MNSFANCRDMEINVFRSQLLKGFHFKSLRKISINFMIIFFFAERVWGVRRMVYVHVEYTTIFCLFQEQILKAKWRSVIYVHAEITTNQQQKPEENNIVLTQEKYYLE